MSKISPISDDLEITLVLRHAPKAKDPVFSEEIEMKCILRKFGKHVNKSVILLSPVHMQTKKAIEIAQRFHSFGSIPIRNREIFDESSSFQKQPKNKELSKSLNSLPPRIQIERKSSDSTGNFNSHDKEPLSSSFHRRQRSSPSLQTKKSNSIAFQNEERIRNAHSLNSMNNIPSFIKISEIHEVSTIANASEAQTSCVSCITIATKEESLFELTLQTKNTYHLMMTFLKSSLSQSCFPPPSNKKDQLSLSPSSNSIRTHRTSSFDMDIFTAKEIAGWQQNESLAKQNQSFADQIRRRANNFSSKLDEFTTSIIECVPCACGADNVIPYESAQYSPEKKVTTSFSQKPDDIPGISRHQLILSYESEQSENRSKNKKDSKRGVENRSQ